MGQSAIVAATVETVTSGGGLANATDVKPRHAIRLCLSMGLPLLFRIQNGVNVGGRLGVALGPCLRGRVDELYLGILGTLNDRAQDRFFRARSPVLNPRGKRLVVLVVHNGDA